MNERPLKWYKKLQEISARKESGYFLAEGLNVINQIVSASPDSIVEIIHSQELPANLKKYPARLVGEAKINAVISSKSPQGFAALVKVPKDIYDNSFSIELGNKVLLLDGVSDPGNTGALIRSASALGFDGIVLTAAGCDALAPKVVAASAGTLFSIWLKRMPNAASAIDYFRRHGFKIIGTSLKGVDDISVLKREKLLLVLGNETHGISADAIALCNHILRLPIDSMKAESLNVAVTGSICMYLANH